MERAVRPSRSRHRPRQARVGRGHVAARPGRDRGAGGHSRRIRPVRRRRAAGSGGGFRMKTLVVLFFAALSGAIAETLFSYGMRSFGAMDWSKPSRARSEEHTSELQSLRHLVCRLLLEKK